ncbi:MAG: hypothetical protein ACTSUE_23010, partial [Promethearchaeota archaeon]
MSTHDSKYWEDVINNLGKDDDDDEDEGNYTPVSFVTQEEFRRDANQKQPKYIPVHVMKKNVPSELEHVGSSSR